MDKNTELIIDAIDRLCAEKEHIIIAIDGRCASGKTTLAGNLRNELSCNVFHTDDFFLRREQRTKERLSEAGGNLDRERFFEEVLLPLSKGEEFSYYPFSCRTFSLKEPVSAPLKKVNIIEGAYSCHPLFRKYYDLRVFLSVSAKEQQRRIIKRNGEDAFKTFAEKWIPLEERYFKELDVESCCEIKLFT